MNAAKIAFVNMPLKALLLILNAAIARPTQQPFEKNYHATKMSKPAQPVVEVVYAKKRVLSK